MQREIMTQHELTVYPLKEVVNIPSPCEGKSIYHLTKEY